MPFSQVLTQAPPEGSLARRWTGCHRLCNWSSPVRCAWVFVNGAGGFHQPLSSKPPYLCTVIHSVTQTRNLSVTCHHCSSLIHHFQTVPESDWFLPKQL